MRVLALLMALSVPASVAEQPPTFADFSKWEILDPGSRAMPYLNRPSLYLERGIALMPDMQFADGTIEFDVAIHGHTGFAGVVFRGEGRDDFELIYLRTHRSRQWDALQYTPMFAGQEAWQLYAGPGYNGAAELPANRWVHVRIVVEGYEARVFVDHAASPQLVVNDLKRTWARGRVGLWGRSGAANFSNVAVTPVERPAPVRPAAPATAEGVITRWSISQSHIAVKIPRDRVPEALNWEAVPSEQSGIVNIAKHRHPVARTTADAADDGRDTVFARAILRSSRAQRVRLSFGYSDDVTVFLDGEPLFSGRGGYLLRDGSYLGTLNLGPDVVFLDLSAGRHELVFAVTEAFGGWGVAARLEGARDIIVE
jgi:hypothetical protein